ncbi:hypothetical protein FY036_07680 [Mesorhizobium microcysteis]|uniref:Uncharacterized protein n=1 Tax=Neoaquamicrobium microcysteis TaxID=2682781 RepID=A0A5D4GX54_9HYPH|nr:hypothetical protein [Mesorhizobium microcysteis]TYR33451.1 hypothetical protein FY036_07680 [Mesorhizobium microcysteis]
MSKFVRILAFVCLAAFAAGTAANAAASTEMSLMMSMSSMDDGGMADCQDCPGDDSQASECDQFCVTSLAAICTPAGTDLPNVTDVVVIGTPTPTSDLSGPPDLHPPRTIRLG